MANPNS
ncbi:ABC transporter family protein, partial [Vibrio parahaemolyticus V-223/04]